MYLQKKYFDTELKDAKGEAKRLSAINTNRRYSLIKSKNHIFIECPCQMIRTWEKCLGYYLNGKFYKD
jgi:hypothetical protein